MRTLFFGWILFARSQHYPLLLFTIHHDAQGFVEVDMPHMFRLLDSRHGIQQVLPPDALTRDGIDGEITDTETGEVLEEMRSLAWVYAVVFECHLSDEFCAADMGPFHGNAQPIVTGAPTSGSDEHIPLALGKEFSIDALYLGGYHRIVGSGEIVVRLYVDHVRDLLTDAMPQRQMRTEQTILIRDGAQVGLQHLLGIDNGTNLQQIEVKHTSVDNIAGKLYFHRPVHAL